MIYEMHGHIFDTICTACNRTETSYEASLCPALAAAHTDDFKDDNVHDIPLEDLPRCGPCGGLLRPGVVWFGETPRKMRDIWNAVDEADMCLVIGTSSTVNIL